MASEAKVDRENIIKTLEALDIAHMKENIYEHEERDNIYYMLEILAKIQQRK